MTADSFFRFCGVLSASLLLLARPAAAVDLTVDLSATPTAISPLVYGLNDWYRNATTDGLNYTQERLGGNRLTGYNWENNASNAGSDYINHSDNNLVNSVAWSLQSVPGEGVFISVDHARQRGGSSLVTLQLAGYVAADKNGTVADADVAPSSRWKAVVVRKGSAYSLTPSTTDGYVYLDEELNCLVSRYGRAAQGGIAAYALDNEPALWPYTHALLHPVKPTCAEIVESGAAVAAMVKDMDGGAEVYGPVLYGWSAFMNFQDAADWTNALSSQYYWFVSYYLEKMKEVSDIDGRRLLDVLDLHYYPEVYANNSSGASTRITGNDSSGNLAAARMQATRSLWDETYDEASWITGWIGEPVKLVPRLKESIAQYYPGTKIGLSEYCFGGINDYSGGIAQADALGIFGKSGVYAACYWGEIGGYIAPAFRIFRNYDGANSTFGDLSLATNAPDVASYSLYASRESGTGALHLVAINKTASAEVANVSLAGSARVVTSARVFGFSEAGGAVLSELTPVASISGNAFTYTLPAHSVLHFVFADPDVSGLKAEQDVGAALVHLYFRTTPGATYRLQSGTNLADWSNVDETTYQGDGGVLLVNRPLPAVETFWRFVTVE